MPPVSCGRRRFLLLGVRAAGLPCLVVGGGTVGTRKALSFLAAGAAVTVVAPRASATLREATAQGKLSWRRRPYVSSDLDGVVLAVAATDDPALNRRIGREADARRILCCVASDARSTRLLFPAVYDDGRVSVAVTSHGRDRALACAVRGVVSALVADRRRRRQA